MFKCSSLIINFFLGKYIINASFSKKLENSKDVVDAIDRGNEISNQYRHTCLGLPPINVKAFVFPSGVEDTSKNFLEINGVSFYYNLQNVLKEDGIF